ncbi:MULTISPECIES: hypothetical protein [unclassified Methylobacterium]|uniref:hypothetical protein n=1 Tax=unclassified Methylobacterium TaxID=2615210 RepID=UPI001FEE5232|nr:MULTISPECIES: hypothetical protein [unclassified Methylobacterium]
MKNLPLDGTLSSDYALSSWIACAVPVALGFGAPISGMLFQCRALNNLGPGDAMLLAAVLFVIGLLIGWAYTMLVMIATSFLILVGAVLLFAFGPGLDLLHVLIILGYLTAHQSGYLFGAYCSGYFDGKRNRQSPLP